MEVVEVIKGKDQYWKGPNFKKWNGSSYYQSCERICFEYYMMIQMLTGKLLLIDIFGKLVYLLPVERYEMHVSRTCV